MVSAQNSKQETVVWYCSIIVSLALVFFLGTYLLNILETNQLAYLALAGGVAALGFSVYQIMKILKCDPGNPRMVEISTYIQEGAMTFLKREYSILSVFVLVVFGLLSYFIGWKTGVCFITGATCSAFAGYVGMMVSTRANTRTAAAAMESKNSALKIAFSGGAVMGMTVVGLGLTGLAILYYIFRDPDILSGFALGGSSIAIFARAGGGIYTKAADVGADLVGKVEAGIPEDSPKNPAVIADNVGDNVGDVAGMGADLFESYVGSIVAAMTLGFLYYKLPGLLLPLVIAAAGIAASMIGVLFVRTDEKTDPMKALNAGVLSSSVIMVVLAYFAVTTILPSNFGVFWALLVGLIAGSAIGMITEYYTSSAHKPVQDIVKASLTGPATTIISGLGVGMFSIFFPVLLICGAIIIAYNTCGVYGIAMAAVGMLATTGMVVAVDAYGPISDNAGGIAEMAELPKEVRKTTDALDSVGNTTAAIGKGFAIGSAALASLALVTAFTNVANVESVDILRADVSVGVLFGASLPFVFCALTMGAVGKAANQMVEEVRRQFREIEGILEGTGKPDYAKCVDISTTAALKEMSVSGLLAVLSPIIVGFGLGAHALAGMLIGSIASGVCLAIMLANAGGAWDNAKKYIEEGNAGGKNSVAHQAAVIGDTVGDPCKDTSGPSLNILLKLMAIVSLVLAPLFMM
ncbi:MAG: sodium-translocating pyrophosphatase [Vampirovibrionia bacterium]